MRQHVRTIRLAMGHGGLHLRCQLRRMARSGRAPTSVLSVVIYRQRQHRQQHQSHRQPLTTATTTMAPARAATALRELGWTSVRAAGGVRVAPVWRGGTRAMQRRPAQPAHGPAQWAGVGTPRHAHGASESLPRHAGLRGLHFRVAMRLCWGRVAVRSMRACAPTAAARCLPHCVCSRCSCIVLW